MTTAAITWYHREPLIREEPTKVNRFIHKSKHVCVNIDEDYNEKFLDSPQRTKQASSSATTGAKSLSQASGYEDSNDQGIQ